MIIMDGERLKNKLTQDLFKIKRIENEKVVMLEMKRIHADMVSKGTWN
jgi:hypothetical protein